MHISSLLAVLALAGTGSALRTRQAEPAEIRKIRAEGTATKRYIIEAAEGVDPTELGEELGSREGTKVLRVFNSAIFAGVSVESNEDNGDSLQALERVNKVWHSGKVQLAPSVGERQSFSSNAHAGNYTIHDMTGVDKVHEQGILGEGVVIAVVDTGIYYNHPALGGGYGPGYKVAGGWDFVGNGHWPESGDAEPDNDPEDLLGHGSHVAGIIVGETETWHGVAPKATLMAYKVFSQEEGTDEDTLIDAFLAAYEADVDIITSSVGRPGGWSSNAWAVVASRIVESGILVTISAGNNGDQGPFFAGTGSTGHNVLSVASVDATVFAEPSIDLTFTLDGVSNVTSIAYLYVNASIPKEATGLPVYPLSLDTSDLDYACNKLPDNTPDLSNVIVLTPIGKGNCSYYQKQENIEAFGGKYILFHHNPDIFLFAPWSGNNITTMGMIEEKAGLAIIETVRAGGSVTASFARDPDYQLVGVKNDFGGLASSFSSLGSTYQLEVKPDIAAPGGSIFSTYPPDTFETMSGTSMACPYVAGVAALYISKHGGKKVHGKGFGKELAARIMSSASSVKWTDGWSTGDSGVWANPLQVGTGLINAAKLLEQTTTSVSFTKFALNDTHHFNRYHKVDITNSGTEPVTFTFSLEEAGAIKSFGFPGWSEGEDPPIVPGPGYGQWTPLQIAPKVKFPSGKFTVKPGQTKTAEFSFEIPTGMDETQFPAYGGKVLITGSNGHDHSVIYAGVGANVKKTFDHMFEVGLPTCRSTWDLVTIEEKPTFTFQADSLVQDYARMFSSSRWGSEEIRWDIFEAGWKERSWTYPPTPGVNGYLGAATSYDQSNRYQYFDPEVNDENDLVSFPLMQNIRGSIDQNYAQFWWLGRFANGTQITPGNYTMRFAALKPFGRREASDNWSFWTRAFTVLPKP